MEQDWFERLTEVMGRLASNDKSALEALYLEFGDPIRGLVRRELRQLGVPVGPAEVDGLTLDVCGEVSRRAGSWDAAHGTTPWVWARLRVRAMVCAYVGPFADPLPDAGLLEAQPMVVPAADGGDDDVLVALGRLAAKRADVRLLHEALDRVSRPGQQEVLFECKLQAAQGDPSPALTVARDRALRPESVRQTCKRVLDKVRRLATDDPYFAPLADLPLLRRAS